MAISRSDLNCFFFFDSWSIFKCVQIISDIPCNFLISELVFAAHRRLEHTTCVVVVAYNFASSKLVGNRYRIIKIPAIFLVGLLYAKVKKCIRNINIVDKITVLLTFCDSFDVYYTTMHLIFETTELVVLVMLVA